MEKSLRLKIRENITLSYSVSISCFAVLKSPAILSQSESLEVQLPLSVMVCSDSEFRISTSSSTTHVSTSFSTHISTSSTKDKQCH